jgi:hypothetical protein
MKATDKIIGGLVLAGMLATTETGLGLGAASPDSFSSISLTETPVQAEPLALSATDMSSLRSLSDAQLETFVNLLDATPTIPMASLPRGGRVGTFWSLQNPTWPPLPFDSSGAAAWPMSDGAYLLNDVNFDYNAASAVTVASGPRMRAMSMDVPGPPGFGDTGDGTNTFTSYGSSYTAPDYGTNLWICGSKVPRALKCWRTRRTAATQKPLHAAISTVVSPCS